MLQKPFIDTYIKNCNFFALSTGSPVDQGNIFAILPTGELKLVLDKETYQTLGLEGKHTSFKDSETYRVTVDLLKPSFQPGKKMYEKVQFCLSDRISRVQFMCFAEDKITGKTIEIHFPSEYKVKQIHNTKKKLKWKEILAPTTLSFDKVPESLDSEKFLLSVYDWIGIVCLESEQLLKDFKTQSSIYSQEISSSLIGSIPNLQKMNLKGNIINGFISPFFAKTIIENTVSFVQEQKLPFGVVVVKGDLNSPISWASHEHGFSCSGENDYAFLVLPDGRYINFLAIGNQDTYS